MKSKKLCILSAGLILASSSLASCSGDDTLTLVFWHTFGSAIQRQVQSQLDEFVDLVYEEEGLEIEVSFSYRGDYDATATNVIQAFSTSNQPDLVVAYPDNVADYLAQESYEGQYVVNLDDYIYSEEYGLDVEDVYDENGTGVDDIVPAFLEEGQNYIREGTYSLPYIKSTEIMLYNADIVSQVLLDMGSEFSGGYGHEAFMANITWNQLMQMLEFINENKNKSGYEYLNDVEYPLFYDSDANLYISQSYQRDIDYISLNEDGTGSIDFVNDEAKAMVQELKDLHDDGILVTKALNDGEYGSNYFIEGNCVFVVGSTGGTGYSDPGVSFDCGVCVFPTYTTAEENGLNKYVSQGVTLAMLNNTKYSSSEQELRKELTWKLVKYLTNTENSIYTALASNGYIPAKLSCYENEDYAGYLAESDFMSQAANIVVNTINGNYFNYPVFRGSDTARDAAEGIISGVLSGRYTIDEAFENAYATVIQAL